MSKFSLLFFRGNRVQRQWLEQFNPESTSGLQLARSQKRPSTPENARRAFCAANACHRQGGEYDRAVKKRLVWPVLLIVVFALSRWPGLMPPNFSAAYAILFCAGLYLPGR